MEWNVSYLRVIDKTRFPQNTLLSHGVLPTFYSSIGICSKRTLLINKSQLGELSWSKYLSRYRMSVRRRDLIEYFEETGFYLLREGKKHSIPFTQITKKTTPIKSEV